MNQWNELAWSQKAVIVSIGGVATVSFAVYYRHQLLNLMSGSSIVIDSEDGPGGAANNAVAETDGPGGFRFGRSGGAPAPTSGGASSVQRDNAIASQLNLEPNSFYPMNTTRAKGIFVIINNRDFLPGSGMEDYPRKGTDEDARQLRLLFSELGFTIHEFTNASAFTMQKELKKISDMDHSGYSAFGCAILSHGEEDFIYGTDQRIEIKSLTDKFKGKLPGKPKLFIIQACQGSEYMDAVIVPEEKMETDGPAHMKDTSLPMEADFLYAYSTVPGYYSWRNSQKGSWFVQSIVTVFRNHAHKLDVGRLMTRVNNEVSQFKSNTGQRQTHNKRQISSIVSQLRYDLYLFPSGPLRPSAH